MSLDPNYERKKRRAADASAVESRAGRDVAPLPPVVNPARKAQARESFEFFARTYYPHAFSLAWSQDHRRAIERIEQAVRHGGLFAYAMPRGSGKTTLAETAAQWAILFGFREFPCLIGSDAASACELLESIRTELSCNDLLLEDFPEVCHPIRKLEGIAHRCNGQLYNGKRTHVGWMDGEIVLPTIPGSPASGRIIRVAGITGRVRGMKYKRPDGINVRPDLVIIDDPQTDESAKSPSQCAERERVVTGAVLGLAGPGKKISGVMPCTVIRPGDLADRVLDREKHPEWQGERTKLIYSFPTNEGLWEQYFRVRGDSLRAGNGGREATEFYVANREAMDAGAVAAWAVRFNPDEASAVQHAMNLRQDRGPAAFAAEYQNDPLLEQLGEELLTADEITKKTNGVSRGRVPLGCEHLTAFVDVQGKLLYWLVAGWGDGFTGAVIDYGAYPDQRRGYFSLADARRTLATAFPKADQNGQIYAGIEALTADLFGRTFTRADGAEMKVGRLLIDANWGKSTDVVYQACRQGKHGALVMPSHGKYVGAGSLPWDQYTKKPGETLGHHWLIPSVKGKRACRHVLIDTNYWKSLVHDRFRVAMGDKGCLSLYGHEPEAHRMIAEHLTAEYAVETAGRGRKCLEWKPRPGGPDNHLLDCLVGAAVAASMLGLPVGIAEAPKRKAAPRPRRKVTYLD